MQSSISPATTNQSLVVTIFLIKKKKWRKTNPFKTIIFSCFIFYFLRKKTPKKKNKQTNKIPPRNNTSLAFSVTAERLVKHSPVKPAALWSQLPRCGIVQWALLTRTTTHPIDALLLWLFFGPTPPTTSLPGDPQFSAYFENFLRLFVCLL